MLAVNPARLGTEVISMQDAVIRKFGAGSHDVITRRRLGTEVISMQDSSVKCIQDGGDAGR